MKNKCLSLMLCAALIFTMMATPIIQPPAHAEVIALTTGSIAIALTILAACGITFATTDIGKKCVQQFANDVDEVPGLLSFIEAGSKGGHILVITATILPKVKQLVVDAIDYFKGKSSVNVNSEDFVTYNNIMIYNKSISTNSISPKNLYPILPYSSNTLLSCEQNGVTYHWRIIANEHHFEMQAYIDDNNPTVFNSYDVPSPSKLVGVRFGFYRQVENGISYMTPLLVEEEVDGSGVLGFWTWSGVSSSVPYSLQLNLDSVVPAKVPVNVDTINIGNIDDVNEAIAHGVGAAADGIQADIQKVIDAVNQATATDTAITKDEAQEILGIKDYIEALEAAQDRTIDAIKEGTKEDDMKVPQLPTTITDKFPFCVPFDLIALVKTFNATPEAPKVTVPVVFQSMNYSHDFVFDFSGDDWDKVAAVSRWGILLFFMLGLTLVTRKLIKG